MRYQSATKITQKLECNLLVVTSSHVILCQVGTLRTADFLVKDMTGVYMTYMCIAVGCSHWRQNMVCLVQLEVVLLAIKQHNGSARPLRRSSCPSP
jgi:hypothetical protein